MEQTTLDHRGNSLAMLLNRYIAWVIFAFAMIARVCYLYFAQENPTFSKPTLDEATHLTWAEHLIRDHFRDNTEFFRAPVYPYFLAFLMSLLGKNLFAIKIAQCVIGSLTCAAIAQTAKQIFGSRTAWIAGIWASLNWLFIYYDSLLLVEGLLLFEISAIVLLMTRPHPLNRFTCAVVGILAILAVYTRPNIALFLPFLLLWVWQRAKPQPTKTQVGNLATIFLLLMIGIGSYGYRNFTLFGYWGFLPTQGGINFYIGNRTGATGREAMAAAVTVPPSYGREFSDYPFYQDNVWYSYNYAAFQALGRQPNQAEVSQFWYQQAFQQIADNPSAWLALMGRKLYYFVNAHEIPSTDDLTSNWDRYSGPFKVLRCAPFGLLLCLAAMAAYWHRNRWRELWPLAALLGIYGVSVVAFFVNHRFRLPIVPILGIFSAASISYIITYIHSFSRRDYLAIGVIAAIVLPISYSTGFAVTKTDSSPFDYNLGNVYLEKRQYAEAAEAFERAAKAHPHTIYYNALAMARLSLKQYDASYAALNESIALDPRNPQTLYYFGYLYYSTDHADQALDYFHQTETADPNFSDPKFWYRYAVLLDKRGNTTKATEHYKKAAELYEAALKQRVGDANDIFLLGVIYSMFGANELAQSYMQQGLDKDPQDAEKHLTFAEFLQHTGQTDLARQHEEEGQRLRQ